MLKISSYEFGEAVGLWCLCLLIIIGVCGFCLLTYILHGLPLYALLTIVVPPYVYCKLKGK